MEQEADVRYRFIRWKEVTQRARMIHAHAGKVTPRVYGVPRGGCAVAALVGTPVDTPEDADVIVDDVIDSGATRDLYAKRYPGKPFFALIDKQKEWQSEWLVFPWELNAVAGEGGIVAYESAEQNVTRLLQLIGEDPTREGLRDTPRRYVRALEELTQGYRLDPSDMLKVQFAERYDEMVVVKQIPFWSLCEHHLMPFHGHATLGYVPAEKVVGLSKLPRLVHVFARRLQVQERMTRDIAQAIDEHLSPLGVAVVVRGYHTCMAMRGVRSEGEMVTSAMLGCFRDGAARAEFLDLTNGE